MHFIRNINNPENIDLWWFKTATEWVQNHKTLRVTLSVIFIALGLLLALVSIALPASVWVKYSKDHKASKELEDSALSAQTPKKMNLNCLLVKHRNS